MFRFLKLCINKKVDVYYIEKGIDKNIKGTLKSVDDEYKAIFLQLEDSAMMRMGFVSNFSAIKCIRYKGIPVYNNSNIPPRYGYNPLGIPNNINEKNKQLVKKFGKKD